jgi:hypothetical protein
MDSTPQRGAGIYTPNRRSRSVAPKYNPNDSIDNHVDAEADSDGAEITTICVVGEKLRNDAAIMANVNSFNLKVVFSR